MIKTLFPAMLIAALSACVSSAGAARTHNVTSSETLAAAIARADDGDRILMATGNYGDVDIKDRQWKSNVTLESASADQPARFDTLTVSATSHLVIKSVEIGRARRANEPDYIVFGKLRSVSDVTLDNVFVRGSMDNNALNDGNGLNITDSRNVTIRSSRFEQLVRGLQLSLSTDIVVSDNIFRSLRSDGMNFVSVQRMLIEGNQFSDFFVSAGDHPDAIQSWTTGTKQASTDIVIRNNQILQGHGAGAQGIFLTDQVGTLPYERVRIENNLLYVYDGYNGIMVGHGREIQIIGNSVLSSPGDNKKFWIRLNKVEGAEVRGNIADSFVNQDNRDLDLKDNIFLDSRSGYGRRIADLGANADARPERLTTAGVGYQPPAP
jgi:Right handed beta helix region